MIFPFLKKEKQNFENELIMFQKEKKSIESEIETLKKNAKNLSENILKFKNGKDVVDKMLEVQKGVLNKRQLDFKPFIKPKYLKN